MRIEAPTASREFARSAEHDWKHPRPTQLRKWLVRTKTLHSWDGRTCRRNLCKLGIPPKSLKTHIYICIFFIPFARGAFNPFLYSEPFAFCATEPADSHDMTCFELADHSAIARGTDVAPTNANSATHITAQRMQGLWTLAISMLWGETWPPTHASDSNNYRTISPLYAQILPRLAVRSLSLSDQLPAWLAHLSIALLRHIRRTTCVTLEFPSRANALLIVGMSLRFDLQ